MELKEVCSILMEHFEQGGWTTRAEVQEAFDEASVNISEDPERDFRLALGADPNTVDNLFWWKDCRVIKNGMFTNIQVVFTASQSNCHIDFVAAGKRGWFFVFFETLKKVCKAHGIKEITLANRAKDGFWTAKGFEGPDNHMTYKVI